MNHQAKKTYTARYGYSAAEDMWEAELVEIPGFNTWAKTRPEAEAHLLDALALWLDVEEDQLTIVPEEQGGGCDGAASP